jgi:arsenite methyltransferase
MNQLNEEMTAIYDELPLWSAPFGLKLLEEIQLKRNIKVLDIGFGTGFPLIELAQRFGESSVVYGIDPWKEAVERVEVKIKLIGIKNIRIYNGEAENMPFRDGYFDLIISNNGLNNTLDINIALKDTYRVAKKGTPLVFTANLPGTMMEFYTIFKDVLSKHNLNEEIQKLQNYISEKRKTVDELILITKNAGFEIHKISEEKFHMDFMDGTTFFNPDYAIGFFLMRSIR